MEQMQKATLIGAVVAVLITVGAAVALADQSSPDLDGQEERPGFHEEMHGWMIGHLEEMPMHGGSGPSGIHEFSEPHSGMHRWMVDHLDEMPFHGDSDEDCIHPTNPRQVDPVGYGTSA